MGKRKSKKADPLGLVAGTALVLVAVAGVGMNSSSDKAVANPTKPLTVSVASASAQAQAEEAFTISTTEAPTEPTVETTVESATEPTMEAPTEPTLKAAQPKDYVLNTSSMKVHRPTCSAVAKIKSTNRKDVTEVLADILARGYSPCGICYPY